MRERSYAYLDLAVLPSIGRGLLSPRPCLLWSADGRRVLWANAAGAAFLASPTMAAVAERRFSTSLPSTDQIARFARSTPLETERLEAIRFADGVSLKALSARCRRLALPDGETGVWMMLDARPGMGVTVRERAAALTGLLSSEDCGVAVLDATGRSVAASKDFDEAVPEAAAENLVAALRSSGEALVKRAIRINGSRRPSGLLRFEYEGAAYHLWIVGPAERIDWEISEPAPVPALAAAVVPAPEAPASIPANSNEPVPEEPPVAEKFSPSESAVGAEGDEAPNSTERVVGLSTGQALAEGESAAPIVPAPEPVVTELSGERAAEVPYRVEPTAEEFSVPDTRPAGFIFTAPSGPVRFVFQMDAEGRFSFVSPEFAAAVGPISADIVGQLWLDVATARGLDRDGAIAALIRRRDTWSGVTLEWPVDGDEAHIAVDLAALPAFSRDRAFEGYRGFGVIRPSDTRREPASSRSASVGRPKIEPPKSDATRPTTDPIANVVRLPRAAGVDLDKLSVPEQDAFRRIAAALGARTADEAAAAAKSAETADLEPAAPHASPASTPETVIETIAAGVVAGEATAPIAAAKSGRDEPAPVAVATEPLSLPDTEALAAANQKIAELETILDTATDGVVVLNATGRIERINRTAEALFGVESAAVAGLQFADLLAEESRKSAEDYWQGLAENGVASVLNDGREVIGRVPQGGLIPLFMTMGRLGETGKFCAVLRDITHWKNAEEELVNARRAAETASMQKSDFLAKISHEIRTPLNAIIGFSEVMMEERFGPIGTERYKEYLRDIHISGAHLMSLLNDLLDLSKIEAGKLDLAFEAVPLNDVVLECVALMQPQANRERIIIRTSLSPQVTRVVADSRSIRQIVLNLLSNAVKFTLAGGQVIVSTTLEERGEVTLRIRDTGVGMSEKDIETALKPFRQLTTSPKNRNDGTGLGLPLTKALVEANRAAFAVDSAVGQGTLIRVTFPTTRVLTG